MKLLLDEYCYLNSYIHLWENKPKFIALISLIFAFALIEKLILLPLIVIISIILYSLSNLPPKFLLSRLRYPGLFIIAVVTLLPFFVGKTIIFNWGIFAIKQEGCLLVLLIVTRFICILTITLVLFGTAPFFTMLKTLRELGLSPIISDMMLLTYRYLEELSDRLVTMQRALKLKGFHVHKVSKRNLKVIASLMGTLLVRSYDDSKLVYQAMILRGYGHQQKVKQNYHQPIRLTDWIACAIVVTISFSLIIGQKFIS